MNEEMLVNDDGSRRNEELRASGTISHRPMPDGVGPDFRWARFGSRVEAYDRTIRRLLRRASPMLLRVSLGLVFVWFGALKVAGVSAVGGLVAATVPFADPAWFVPALGVVEILTGVAFVTGRFLRAVLPVFVAHMAGTFLVLIVLPDVAFQGGNPMMLTAEGEYVVKNLVLLSAGLVVASGVKPLRAVPRTGVRSRVSGGLQGKARPSRSIARLSLWLVVLVLAATACASESSAGASAVEGSAVAVRDYQFAPPSLLVEAGDTVTWTWEGRAPHNVVGQAFQSRDQSSGTFRHTFQEPGTFAYECTIHPGMEGSIVVERPA
jgi:putative oxidoreductase